MSNKGRADMRSVARKLGIVQKDSHGFESGTKAYELGYCCARHGVELSKLQVNYILDNGGQDSDAVDQIYNDIGCQIKNGLTIDEINEKLKLDIFLMKE